MTGQDDSSEEPSLLEASGSATAFEPFVAPGRRNAGARFAIITVAGVLFIAVLSVIFVLPNYIPDESSNETVDVESTTGAAPTVAADAVGSNHESPAEPGPAEADSGNARRLQAQTKLDALLRLVDKLKQRNIEQWAGLELDNANTAIAIGEEAYREQRYRDAVNAYDKAQAILGEIEQNLPTLIAGYVEEGYQAIELGDSAAATTAFNFALLLDPKNTDARSGLQRSATLDQVNALIREAHGFEQLDQADKALSRYKEALALDKNTREASEAIKRIKGAKVDQQFRRAMSDAITAFAADKDQKAKDAYKRALGIRPNAREAKEGLAQVEARILQQKIAARLRQGATFADGEKWTEAATAYRQALRLDGGLDSARRAATTAERRAKLDKQLQAILARPERLGDEAVRTETLGVLKVAKAQSPFGPRIAGQTQRIEGALALARAPINVTFLSDSQTEVTLYKVGTLGQFQSRDVPVLPGRYVAVGKRNGYRDVRVEFYLAPGQAAHQVDIRCEQKLAFGN